MSRVRIVGGRWRSRLIDVASVPGLRPTPDRVRETLFNWLSQDLSGMRCLDLFAGSGVLGFEAASRGAAETLMLERDPAALSALHKTAKTRLATQVEIVRGDAVKFLQTTSRTFDVVFVDPPYKQGWIERIAPWLDRVLQPEGWLYVEAEAALAQLGEWRIYRQGHAGQVHFHLLRRGQE